MVSGRLQCLGSCQHLKGRFGASYQIEVRCDPEKTEQCLRECLQNIIPNSVLEEKHGTFFRLNTKSVIDLAFVFNSLDNNKSELGILEYSVSQATLEQIFIRFAKEQEEEKSPIAGIMF